MSVKPSWAALILLSISGTACTPLPERVLEVRAYADNDYKAVFRDFRLRCRAKGRRVYIVASGKVGRDGTPARGDRYYCV